MTLPLPVALLGPATARAHTGVTLCIVENGFLSGYNTADP